MSFQFDCSSGLLTKSTDQNSNPTKYYYTDPLNRLTSISYPDGGGTTNIYTDYSGSGADTSSVETEKSIDSSGHLLKTYQILDGLGLVTQTQTQTTDSGGNICVDTAYDGFERALTVSNPHYNCSTPYGYLTTYAYDPLGRTTSVLYPDSTAATSSYNGLTATVQDAGGKTRTLVSDELGHLVSVTEDPNGLGYVTNYPNYSALDDLLTVSQSSQTRSFSYDSFSRLTQAINPESGTINYGYDGNGNVISKQGPLGTASYTYDELNRVLTKNFSDTSTLRACYGYDGVGWTGANESFPGAVGHLTASWSVNHDGTVVAAEELNTFDPMGRAVAGRQCTPGTCGVTWYPLAMSYNYLSNETGFSDPAQTRSTGYDSTDRLLSFAATLPSMGNQNLLTSPQYNALGLTQVSLGNGLTESRGYNLQRTWLNSVQVGSVYSFSIPSFDGNGNVLTASDNTNGNWTYGYDSLNRLQTATVGGQSFSYNPDQYGNMWCSAPTGTNYSCTPMHGSQLNLHMNFNAANQIWDDGDGVYQYDAAGNLTQDGTHGYVYDLENRLTCVLGTDGTCTSSTAMLYLYDAAGQRVGKQWANNLEDYVHDPQGHMTSVYANGSASAERAELYTPGGRHVATWNPSAIYFGPLYWNHADWLGTERARTDSTGTVREWNTDTPYGMNLASYSLERADPSPMHFTGKQRDAESGLDYFGARYLGGGDNLGRWLSADSSGPDLTNPQSLNKYRYGLNNPLRYTDPNGRYEDDVHKDLTTVLAYAAGYSNNQASAIGNADQDVDDNPETGPFASERARELYHFTTPGRRAEMLFEASIDGTEEAYGIFLHAEQDSFAHEGYGPLLEEGRGSGTLFGRRRRWRKGVTVGTDIADRPPHRSVRARLTHTALTSDVWRQSAR